MIDMVPKAIMLNLVQYVQAPFRPIVRNVSQNFLGIPRTKCSVNYSKTCIEQIS